MYLRTLHKQPTGAFADGPSKRGLTNSESLGSDTMAAVYVKREQTRRKAG